MLCKTEQNIKILLTLGRLLFTEIFSMVRAFRQNTSVNRTVQEMA